VEEEIQEEEEEEDKKKNSKCTIKIALRKTKEGSIFDYVVKKHEKGHENVKHHHPIPTYKLF